MRNIDLLLSRSTALRIVSSALICALGGLTGCYPKAGPPPAALSQSEVARASERWPGVTANTLAAGHDIFLAKCNGCHDYPDLTPIADDRWPGILDTMAKKAHLNADERDEVLHFVLAARAEQTGR